ncbi:ABC transporter transmembrane domain-containing protein [Rhodobacteraceae bacterium]|nr:ABC transporter transmembrane domain-containing protein [Paracoccaceae bacterium]
MRADSILISSRRAPSVILASFGANLLSLALPMAMIHIYDRVIPNTGLETLTVLGIVVFVSIFTEVILRSARRHILERAAERFELAAYPAALRSLISSDPTIHDRASQGELYRSVMAIDRLRSMHVGETSMALLDLPFAFLFLGIIVLISPTAGLSVFLILSSAFLILRFARRRVLALQVRRKENEARRHSFLSETLRGLDVVKGMRIEDFMMRRYERLLAGSAEVSADTAKSVQLAQGFTAAVGTLSPLLMASIGAFMVIHGDMTIGALAAVVLLTGRIIQPILRVEAFLAGMDNVRQDRQDLEDVLAAPMIKSGETALATVETLTLDGVSTEEIPGLGFAFSNITLELNRGECVAIAAPDKPTKTAFLRLLAGEVPLRSGQIMLNGRPFFEHDLEDRQKRVRYFSPENELIEGTLIDNMTVFRPRLYRDKAVELAQQIGIERSISQSPDGYALRVGQGAKALLPKSLSDAALIVSGLVTEPDVVLFDEANAALDREIDQKLLAILDEARAKRITILVSSRPSYLKLAERTIDITDCVQVSSKSQDLEFGGAK